MGAASIRPYPGRRVTNRDASVQPVIWPAGTAAPAAGSCIAGDLFLDTDASANGSLYCFNGTVWKKVADLT
jgi:hypothetical protein